MGKLSSPQASCDGVKIIRRIVGFLKLFMCETLAKRTVSIVLIAVGVPNTRVTELTGLCDKSVRVLKKTLESGEIEGLLHVGGGGRKHQFLDVEQKIIAEVNTHNYHSRQQIVDMVQEKFGLKMSLSTVGRLLKKTV